MLVKVDVGLGEGGVLGVDGVVVLALGVQDLAQRSAVADPLHLPIEAHMGVVLGQHEDGFRLLISLCQLNALGHGAVADALAEHVDPPLEQADHEGRVLMEKVGHDDRVHVMLNEIVEMIVYGHVLAQRGGRLFPSLGVVVADGHHLTAQKHEVPHNIHAAAYAEHADPDLFHHLVSFIMQFPSREPTRFRGYGFSIP